MDFACLKNSTSTFGAFADWVVTQLCY